MKNLLMLICIFLSGASALASEQSMSNVHGLYNIKLIKEYDKKKNIIVDEDVLVYNDRMTPVDMTINDNFSNAKIGFNFTINKVGGQYLMNIVLPKIVYNDLIPLEDNNDYSSNLNKREPKHHYYQAFDLSRDVNIDNSKIFNISIATDSALVIGKEYLEITKAPIQLKR